MGFERCDPTKCFSSNVCICSRAFSKLLSPTTRCGRPNNSGPDTLPAGRRGPVPRPHRKPSSTFSSSIPPSFFFFYTPKDKSLVNTIPVSVEDLIYPTRFSKTSAHFLFPLYFVFSLGVHPMLLPVCCACWFWLRGPGLVERPRHGGGVS